MLSTAQGKTRRFWPAGKCARLSRYAIQIRDVNLDTANRLMGVTTETLATISEPLKAASITRSSSSNIFGERLTSKAPPLVGAAAPS
jgi:hypothetical protein